MMGNSLLGDPSPPIPIGLALLVGAGKTEWAIAYVRDLLAADPKARVAWSVPDHALTAEAATRLRQALPAGTPVTVWRGRTQPDPLVLWEAMCRRAAEVSAVEAAGGEMGDVCGGPRRGYCPFNPGNPSCRAACGYRRQAASVPVSGVVIFTHASLGKLPVPLRRRVPNGVGGSRDDVPAFEMLVIDEAFHPALVHMQAATVPLDDLDPRHWAAIPANVQMLEPRDQAAKGAQAALAILAAAHAVAAAGDGRLSAAMLAQVAPGRALHELSLEFGRTRGYVLRLMQDVKVDPSLDLAGLKAAMGTLPDSNRRVRSVAKLLGIAADVAGGQTGGAALRVSRTGLAGISLSWRDSIDFDRLLSCPGGVLHLDATLPDAIAAAFLPGLQVSRPPPVATPHMRLVQVEDASVGYWKVIPGRAQGVQDVRTAQRNAASIERAIARLAATYRGKGTAGGPDVLVILPKDLEAVLAPTQPTNVGTLHFGALRGQDRFKGVACLVVVSRPLPRPEDMEDMAEVIFATDVSRLPGGQFYPRVSLGRILADGSTVKAEAYRHPDPRVEAVRAAHCEAELMQAIGRGRGLRRRADNALDVFLLTDTVLPDLRPTEMQSFRVMLRDLGGLHPADVLLDAGIVPGDWKGRGLVMQAGGLLQGAKDVADAARQAARGTPDFDARLAAGLQCHPAGGSCANTGVTPLSISKGACTDIPAANDDGAPALPTKARAAAPWTEYRYRRDGERKSARVYIVPWVQDHAKELEQVMGKLAWLERADQAGKPLHKEAPAAFPGAAIARLIAVEVAHLSPAA
jgi:putative DNA primase/helicase